MERNIPHNASESIDFYLRTIYSVLRSKHETRLSGLEEAHKAMDSTMHPSAREDQPDFNAFIYAVLRMPSCLIDVTRVVLGQNPKMFMEQGYRDIDSWKILSAPARRRFWQFDGTNTLAVYINSKSDIEDIIPILVAFQIEWNKLHELLRPVSPELIRKASEENAPAALTALAEHILSPVEDLNRLKVIWGSRMGEWFLRMKERSSEIRIKLLDSSMIQYSRSANHWVETLMGTFPELATRPVYFVSSNTHSIANLITGYALHKSDELIRFLNEDMNEKLRKEYELISEKKLSASKENFLYYILKKYQQSEKGKYTIIEQRESEQNSGLFRIPSTSNYDIEAQIIDLSKIDPSLLDPRVVTPGIRKLIESKAMILNIDYPLGMAAYHLLSKLSERLEHICGVYVMGKAASLNGIHGDVIIPSVVHDMHSANLYLFKNVFSGEDVEPYLVYGSILDDQKAVSVYGTYLQNRQFMDAVYSGGYTDIEMEAGPYLSAIYEMFRPHRSPEEEVVNLYNIKMDIGFMHYVSDTPMSKGKNLGAGTLSYFGMDSTYAISIGILRRIFMKASESIE